MKHKKVTNWTNATVNIRYSKHTRFKQQHEYLFNIRCMHRPDMTQWKRRLFTTDIKIPVIPDRK